MSYGNYHNYNNQDLRAQGYHVQNSEEQEKPTMDSPLRNAHQTLEAAVNELGATADTLQNKLGPVLVSPSPMQTGADLNGVTASHSPLVQEVDQLRQRIERITAGLQDALNRLEV